MVSDDSKRSYHKLIVWQKLRELLVLTYSFTEKLPKSEEFSLKNQMRRAVVSSISNLVEGYLKRSRKAKLNFLDISETSLLELEAQSEICLILKYWNQKDYEEYDKSRSITAYFLRKYIEAIEKND